MSLQDLEEWAGVNSSELISGAFKKEELVDLFMECVQQDDLYEIILEICHNAGYVDWEAVKEDADDAKYQEWKERDID
tara:strand:+ start:1809 stop:2042 length:234 start_codon:yes stop_codon:yes gene_type:complete